MSSDHSHITDWVSSTSRGLPPKLALLHLSISEKDTEKATSEEAVGEYGPPSPQHGNEKQKHGGMSGIRPRPVQNVPAGLLNDFILDSLAYKSMHNREEEVTKAHGDTFEWVFNNAPSENIRRDDFSAQFSSWLTTDTLGPIYWVTGKPGSGKSTFIQFLFQHASTMRHLQAWAGSSHVSKAGFFFWTSGSREQRSQTGLLRYLLHQLLSRNPEFMPSAFGELWQRLLTMTTKDRIKLTLDWTVVELMAAFRAFIDAALPQIKICLFIDGLDEFEGDHVAIIEFFKSLGLGKNGHAIKMCLSSRPWAVFENAFQHAVPNLRLQDLTHDDMYRYARDRLRQNVHVRTLLKGDGALEKSLVDQTVQRADGVFLWVRLAVNEMLENFQSGSNEADLKATLQSLPTELNHLFSKLIFEDQHQTEIAETAILFQLIRARELVADFIKDESSNSLTVWELAFALDEKDDTLATEGSVQEASDYAIQTRCESTTHTIRTRFSGLLDLHGRRSEGNPRVSKSDSGNSAMTKTRSAPEDRVTYIHRTVRDWLMEADGVYQRLFTAASPNFDPHLQLLRSYVLRLKQPLEEVEHHRRLDDWWPDIALAMTHARHIKHDPKQVQRRFVNELNGTLSWYWLRKPRDPYDHWARNAFGAYEVRMKASPIWQPFTCLAIKFGLTQYIREELEARLGKEDDISEEQRELEDDKTTPLLSHATEFLCSRQKTIFPLSDPQLVEYLLRNPQRTNPGPNHEYTDFTTRAPRTPWLAVLRHLRDARRRGWIDYYDIDPERTARWAAIVRLFVHEGADVSAVVVKDVWDPEISAVGVLELLEETYGAIEVKEVKESMVRIRDQ